jgi:hypothetical protein
VATRSSTWDDIRVESCIEVDPSSLSLLTRRNRVTGGHDGGAERRYGEVYGTWTMPLRSPLWHWREWSNLTECGMSRLPEKELELAMEAIQRQESSLLWWTAMLARTVASADREQERCAPDKEQERRTGWPGS